MPGLLSHFEEKEKKQPIAWFASDLRAGRTDIEVHSLHLREGGAYWRLSVCFERETRTDMYSLYLYLREEAAHARFSTVI